MLIRIVEHIDLGEAPQYLGSEETGAINLLWARCVITPKVKRYCTWISKPTSPWL
jgi:hypothetical protein